MAASGKQRTIAELDGKYRHALGHIANGQTGEILRENQSCAAAASGLNSNRFFGQSNAAAPCERAAT
jgi:hypothetical protein